jgi:hypothetical protein
MNALSKVSIVLAAVVSLSASAVAQDSTTTTTTTTTQPAPGVFVGVPGVVGVQVGAPPGGCTTRSSTTTDNDTGASATRSATNC